MYEKRSLSAIPTENIVCHNVSNESDLIAISRQNANGEQCFEQTNDIRITKDHLQVLLGENSSYDGKNHQIVGGKNCIFAQVGKGSTVQNLHVTESDVSNKNLYRSLKSKSMATVACVNEGHLENIRVSNSKVSTSHTFSCGGILAGITGGNAQFTNVTVENSKIASNGHFSPAAAIVGCARGNTTVIEFADVIDSTIASSRLGSEVSAGVGLSGKDVNVLIFGLSVQNTHIVSTGDYSHASLAVGGTTSCNRNRGVKEEDITPSNTIVIATGDNSNVGKIFGKSMCPNQNSSMNTTINGNMIKFDSDRCIDDRLDKKTSTFGSSLSAYNGQTTKTTTDTILTHDRLSSHKINNNTTGTISKIYNERDNSQVDGSGDLLLSDMESINPQTSGDGDFFLSDDEDLNDILITINKNNARSGILFDPYHLLSPTNRMNL